MDVLERATFEVKTFGHPSKESGLSMILEITRLRQLLSEAEKREREARAKALEEAVSVADDEYKRHCTGSGFDSQPARSTAHRILEALKALQSEER